MSYIASITAVEKAVARKSALSWMTHFYINNGEIIGTDGVISSSCPFGMQGSFVVNSEVFSKAVRLLGDNLTYEIVDHNLVLKQGRKKVEVQLLATNEFSFSLPHMEWQPMPGFLIPVLKRCAPFIDENASNAWSNGVWFEDGFAYATNSIAIIRTIGPSFTAPLLIPVQCVEYLVQRNEEPEEYSVFVKDGKACQMSFRYRDKSWVNTRMFEAVPPGILKTLPDFNTADLPPIDASLKKSITDAAAFSDGSVYISDAIIRAGKAPATFEEATEFRTNHDTVWGIKEMAKVMKEADRLDINAWPNPARWAGPSAQGVIAGKTG